MPYYERIIKMNKKEKHLKKHMEEMTEQILECLSDVTKGKHEKMGEKTFQFLVLGSMVTIIDTLYLMLFKKTTGGRLGKWLN